MRLVQEFIISWIINPDVLLTSSTPAPTFPWILDTAVWEDANFWVDTELWDDGSLPFSSGFSNGFNTGFGS
jgi:hypothetical protein